MNTTPMKSNSITAILFDFGGVLAEEGFRDGLISLAREQGLNIEDMPRDGMRAVYDSGFVLGKGTAADFWSLLRQRTGLKGEDEVLTERILNGFVIRPGMIHIVKKLRDKGYVTGILSDQTHWLDELDEHYHFSEAFNRIYNSYYLGKGKRDSSLFLDIAADLEMPPEAILFIDDDEDNITRARKAGYQVIRFNDQDNFSILLERMLSNNCEKAMLNEL